jgi:hypothetical protein
MDQLFLLPGATRESAEVEAWFAAGEDELRRSAKEWFETMRACGADVRILLHDGHPTACVREAAFGYVNAFSTHCNVGFFRGADLPDPARLLEGSGKRMRHVKLRWGRPIDTAALTDLIEAAYRDMRSRLDSTLIPTL